jgi:ankyrin repeat protein
MKTTVAVVGFCVLAVCGAIASSEAQVSTAISNQPEAVIDDGQGELFKAISSGQEQDVRAMLSADPKRAFAKNKNGNSALLFAVYMNKQSIAKLIVGYLNDDLSIFEAAALGSDEKLRSLLAQRPDLSTAFAPDGFTALHLASYFGHPSSQELLIAAGADINAYSRNALHASPLQSAAAARQLGAARLLLEHRANPNAKGEESYTPLHEAAASGQLELVRLLISHGADISVKGDDGKTPADVAGQLKQNDVLILLKKEAK